MLLTSIDPFVQEFDRRFDRLARQAFGGADAAARGAMPLDGVRRKDDVLLRFDLPGIDPDSIEVTGPDGARLRSLEPVGARIGSATAWSTEETA